MIAVLPIAGALGAEISGVDLAKGLDADTIAAIRRAWLEHHEQVNFGGIWHSDTTYLERPPMASMLIAREVPDAGGDTEFANMSPDALRAHLPLPLAPGLDRLLGQPLRPAQRDQRLSRPAPPHAPPHLAGDHPRGV